LLPVITMLEKLGFQSLVEQTITSERIPRAMDLYRFVLGILPGLYIGFPRLNHLRFIARDPILRGILKVAKLPVQSSFWRFVNALHLNVAGQILAITRTMRERVWTAANVKLEVYSVGVKPTRTRVSVLYPLPDPSLPPAVPTREKAETCRSGCPSVTGVQMFAKRNQRVDSSRRVLLRD
jgi:hypothetical protein